MRASRSNARSWPWRGGLALALLASLGAVGCGPGGAVTDEAPETGDEAVATTEADVEASSEMASEGGTAAAPEVTAKTEGKETE